MLSKGVFYSHALRVGFYRYRLDPLEKSSWFVRPGVVAALLPGKSPSIFRSRSSPCEQSSKDIMFSYSIISRRTSAFSMSGNRSANCLIQRRTVLSSASVITDAACSIEASISAPTYRLYGLRKSGMTTCVFLQSGFVHKTCNWGMPLIMSSLDHALLNFHWLEWVNVPQTGQ